MLKEKIELRQLSPSDGVAFYELLQHIGSQENDFTNPVHNMNFEEYRAWLKQQDNWAKGNDLPQNFVPQVCFWLIVNDIPVGFGKIRIKLTEQSRLEGGNLGYAIDNRQRGKGYGSLLLAKLLQKAKNYNLTNPLITVKKFNYASKRVAESNGAILIKETDDWWYLEVNL